MDGVIVVDKPDGWTSHDVVGKMRRIAGTKKIGHLGTLDPIATGVLPLVLNRATRLAQFYTRNDKVYEGLVRFGYATSSYDRTGEPTSPEVEVNLDEATLEAELAKFRGEIMQTPPAVSAKKVGGVRAYKLARESKPVNLAPAPVHIYELKLLELRGNLARLRCHCSGGTYLRSIAHDLGIELGCGAHLQELRRTASGDFELAQSRTLEQLELLSAEGRLAEALIPAGTLLPDFPAVWVDTPVITAIRQGRNFPVSPFRSQQTSRYVRAISRDGDLVAIGEAKLPNLYHPVVVL